MEKAQLDVLGIQTWGCRMVGANEFTELPILAPVIKWANPGLFLFSSFELKNTSAGIELGKLE